LVFLRLAGRELIGRIDPDLEIPVRRPLGLAIDMRKACLFDPQTEILIQ
jgi:hypothetical protein